MGVIGCFGICCMGGFGFGGFDMVGIFFIFCWLVEGGVIGIGVIGRGWFWRIIGVILAIFMVGRLLGFGLVCRKG